MTAASMTNASTAISLKKRYDKCRNCRDYREQRNTAQKRADVFFGILIDFFFWQERETDSLCVPPPEQVDYKQVEKNEPLAEYEKIQECGQITVKGENALENQSNYREHGRKEYEIAEQNRRES